MASVDSDDALVEDIRVIPPDGKVDALVDALGPPPSAVHLLRAVKARLDPEGRLAPGRLGSWLTPA